MRSLLRVISLGALVIMLSGSIANAGKTPTVRPLGFTEILELYPGFQLSTPPDCQIGNLNPAAFAVSDFFFPPEDYAVILDPLSTCSVCTDGGHHVTDIHIIVQSTDACQLEMSAYLAGVDATDPQCLRPGDILCESETITATLTGAGLWDVVFPVTCSCEMTSESFALGYHIESIACDDGSVPDIITDNAATNCVSWNKFSEDWFDPVSGGDFLGNMLIFADVTCCDPTVPTEERSWGNIKNVYSDEE